MRPTSPLLERLGIELPLIQAPMAGVSTPELAAAVSNAGGLGSIAIGAGNAQQARSALAQTRALTSRPFNVNLFCHAPAVHDAAREAAWLEHLAPLFHRAGAQPPEALSEIYRSFVEDDETLELLLEQRPAVVSFHFGLPAAERIKALQDAGICLLATATNLHEAQLIEQAGIDAIVAQGIEAGGHRGMFDSCADDEQLGTSALLALLSQHMTLPIIAAGGIMNGQQIAAALTQGAVAAQLGTAFVLCPESCAPAAYRANLSSEHARNTRLTSAFSGRPARGIVNELIRFCDGADTPVPPDYPIAYDAAKQLHAAASQQGNHAFAAHWAGQGAALARQLPAAELVAVLAREWRESV
ncbi:NAD(P)H-dependent flavin oxidoreductase [Pseudomonas sp.]|uniref:NAD(P)H-dependent flavin oxidoreductase n=1 Tax=Pseudomonas sp. TaxID=306 RepID=UPI000C97BE56|nr:nitronate monooxygenase [Pseudomonadales bacterium]|tara:strand:+ start:817 stop:1884 length:1068 start_codon:yes stop_codon:yes gene_type:complete